jgi:DNA-binding MarR family transcriptional regulator
MAINYAKPPIQQALRSWMDVAMHRSMRGWSHHAKASGLSMPQFSILMHCSIRPLRISDISERFEITPAAASQHVENLVQAGLLERTETPEDRRVRQIQLTPKGRSLIESGIRERHQWMDHLAETLDEKDREEIASALAILTETARKLERP